jgi:hypothetical protein
MATDTRLSRAAADCRTAISERAGDESVDVYLNQGLLNLSRAEFAAMSKKLYRATAEIQALVFDSWRGRADCYTRCPRLSVGSASR